MKDYLKMHVSQAAYDSWKLSDNYVEPNVSGITGTSTVLYNPKTVNPQAPTGE